MCKSLNLQSSKSLYLPFYYNVFMNQVTGCKVYFSSSSEKHVCFNFQWVHVCPIVHVCPTVFRITVYVCPTVLSVSNCWIHNCLNCLYVPNFQVYPTVHLYICPSVSNRLTVSQLSVPNVQGIQLPRSTICHEVIVIFATKVMKLCINKLNSIVLYSSEEHVCLTSSVSKCVH